MDYRHYLNNLRPSHWKSIGILTLAEWACIGAYSIYNSLDYDIYIKLTPSVVLGGLSAYAHGIELCKNSNNPALEEKIKKGD